MVTTRKNKQAWDDVVLEMGQLAHDYYQQTGDDTGRKKIWGSARALVPDCYDTQYDEFVVRLDEGDFQTAISLFDAYSEKLTLTELSPWVLALCRHLKPDQTKAPPTRREALKMGRDLIAELSERTTASFQTARRAVSGPEPS